MFFFLLVNNRLLQRCPLDFLKSSIIRPIVEQIIPNCHLEHRDASASMMAFVQTLAKLTSNTNKDFKVNLAKSQRIFANYNYLYLEQT